MLRKPIIGIAGCYVRAASGQVAAPPSSVMNSRRFMLIFSWLEVIARLESGRSNIDGT